MENPTQISIDSLVVVNNEEHDYYGKLGEVVGINQDIYKVKFEDKEIKEFPHVQLDDGKKKFINNFLKEL